MPSHLWLVDELAHIAEASDPRVNTSLAWVREHVRRTKARVLAEAAALYNPAYYAGHGDHGQTTKEIDMKRVAIATGAAAMFGAALLAGCADMQQAASSPDYAKTRRNAGYGAAAGAVIGLLAGRNKLESALLGAAAGGLAGGAIGNYQDRQEAKLRQQMAGTGVAVQRQGNNLNLDIPGSITFATDSSDLSAGFYPVLDKLAGTLQEYGQTVIQITGYTDSTGSLNYNQQLSQRRAQSVAAYLQSHGVSAQRLVVVGAGPSNPIASNATAEGRQQNRRVELTIVPVQKNP